MLFNKEYEGLNRELRMSLLYRFYLKAKTPEILEEKMFLFNIFMQETHKFDVIHFNNGAWYSWTYLKDSYREKSFKIREKLEELESKQNEKAEVNVSKSNSKKPKIKTDS